MVKKSNKAINFAPCGRRTLASSRRLWRRSPDGNTVMKDTDMTYNELSEAVVGLSYRDKFRLAQLLIQLARKEEEEQYPQKRAPVASNVGTPSELTLYVAERIKKLRPAKKSTLLNSIGNTPLKSKHR